MILKQFLKTETYEIVRTAFASLKQKRFRAAHILFEEALHRESENRRLYIYLAIAYIRAGRLDRIEEIKAMTSDRRLEKIIGLAKKKGVLGFDPLLNFGEKENYHPMRGELVFKATEEYGKKIESIMERFHIRYTKFNKWGAWGWQRVHGKVYITLDEEEKIYAVLQTAGATKEEIDELRKIAESLKKPYRKRSNRSLQINQRNQDDAIKLEKYFEEKEKK